MGAIALNGIGFNLARAAGPALGGFAIAAAGPEAAFALNAFAFLLLIVALVAWRRPRSRASTLPKEHLVGAMRAGLRFVAASPSMQSAILRACAFFLPGRGRVGAACRCSCAGSSGSGRRPSALCWG